MKINKIKRLLALMLCVMLFGATLTTQAALGNMDTSDEGDLDRYPIDEPYEYPVVPGTDEWKALDNNIDKLRVCLIPEEILSRMTTEALLESVLTYPMLVNMLIWQTPQQGYEHILRNFNGLQELTEREDFDEVLETFSLNTASVYSAMTESEQSIVEDAFNLIVFYREHSITPVITMNPIITNEMIQSDTVTLYTPNGLPVVATRNATFQDLGKDPDDAAARDAALANNYPNAVRLAPLDSKYNCHAYAWWSNGASTIFWINNIEPFLEDGTWQQVTHPLYNNDKVVYIDGSLQGYTIYSHSAIVVGTNPCMLISKWDYCGAFRHTIYDCPYYEDTTSYEYWRP